MMMVMMVLFRNGMERLKRGIGIVEDADSVSFQAKYAQKVTFWESLVACCYLLNNFFGLLFGNLSHLIAALWYIVIMLYIIPALSIVIIVI